MNAIHEEDFLGFSYGFRPGRSQHQSLDALATGLKRRRVNWVLDAAIRGFFDAIDHEWLMRFIEHRIADKRVLRLSQKWLSAGVMEKGIWRASEEGTPQGATVSPLLANIYLHYILDHWFQRWRRNQARGDVIVDCEDRSDAEQFLALLRERLRMLALELYPEKTRLIQFGRLASKSRERCGLGKPETFNYLGFTHICGKSKAGFYLVKQHTARTRMTAMLKDVTRNFSDVAICPSRAREQACIRGARLFRVPCSSHHHLCHGTIPNSGRPALVPGAPEPEPA